MVELQVFFYYNRGTSQEWKGALTITDAMEPEVFGFTPDPTHFDFEPEKQHHFGACKCLG